MADSTFNSLEHMLLCHVCFEGFDESGDYVPRLLPCSHTLCHRYLRKLTCQRSVTCPECRTTHTTPESEEGNFPQNSYILTILRAKHTREDLKEVNNEYDKVTSFTKHCTTKENGQKDDKDAEVDKDKKQELLINRIRAVKNTIWKNEFDVRAARAEVEKKSSTAVEKLRDKQEELVDFITKRIEELKKNVVNHKTEVLAKLDQEIGVLEENIGDLESLKDQLGTDEPDSDINNNLESIRKIEQKVKRNQTDIIYTYLEYYENTVPIFDLNKVCGYLRQEERWISQSSEKELTRPRATVLHTFKTGLNTISPAVVLPNETILVAGIENDQPVLKRFDTRTGEKLNTAIIPNLPLSMTQVQVAGKAHLVLASSDECIEFRHPSNLDNIVNSMVVSKPWRICSAASSTTLLHLDKTKFDFLERWDCSTLPPMLHHNVKVTGIKHDLVLDLQFDQWNNKEFLITTCYSDYGIYVYDISDGCLIFNVRGQIPGMKEALKAHGVTSDGSGHLFVCDRGKACIQTFSLADGKYLGALLREGDYGLGEPHWVRWCSTTSSLIVSHGKDDQRYISVVKLRNRSTSVRYAERFSLCS